MKKSQVVLLLTLAITLLGVAASRAQTANGVWNGNSGNWSSTAIWNGGVVPNGTNGFANFGAINITGNGSVTNNSLRTIGRLSFGDSGGGTIHSLTLTASGANTLTLATSSGTPSITVTNEGPGLNVTISAPLAGTQGLIISNNDASSTLTFAVSNNYSGTTTIGAGSNILFTANGGLGSGDVRVLSGATNKLGTGAANANASYIKSTASLLLNGTARVFLNFTGTNAIAGLSFNDGTNFQASGTWGSAASTAAHKTNFFSGAGVLNVIGRPSTNTLVSSANPSIYGSSVTFTSTVTGSGGTPTGTVTFMDGATTLGTGTLNGSGVATFSTNNLTVTSHSITAVFGGDGSFNSSTSSILTQVIDAKSLGITASDTNKIYGQAVIFAGMEFTPSGLVNGDTVDSVTLTSDGAAALATVSGSPYSIVPSDAIGTGLSNYAISYTNGSMTIAKAGATVALGSLSQVYDGTARNASATTVPVGLTVGLTYNGNVAAPTNAGSYEVVGTVADANYAGISTNTLVVGKADATVTLGDLSQVYDGTARNASATTVPVGLTVGLTCDGNVAAPTNAGSYEVVGTVADANYAGISTNTLVVAKADATVTLGDLSQVYDGTARNASATTVPVGLTVGLTYDGNVAAPTNAGSYEVVGTVADANYAGISTNTLVVGKADATVTLGDLSQVYDGTARNASATTVPVGLTVGLTYNGNVAAPTNAGSYEVVGTVADANYAGISTNTLVVAKADATVTLGDLSQVYDGTARNASATTVPVGLTVGLTYDGNVAAPTNAGSYEVVGTVADANYAGVSTNTLVVAKADATVTLGDLSQVYDGTARSASATTVPVGLTVGLTYDGNVAAPTNAGSYEVVGTVADANYAGVSTNTLVVAKADATVTLGDLSQVYDGTARNASATTVPVGLTVGLTYDGNVAAPTNAGSYEVVGTVADANYAGISTNTLVVAKADATVTLGDLSQVYDGTARNASATTVPVGLTVGLTYDGNVAAPTNAGSYEVVGTVADANYVGISTNTLVVAKADATVTLGDLSQVYDGTARSASATTVPVGLTVGLTYDGNVAAPTNAGSYEVVGTVADANYAGVSTNTLVVAKADATVTLGDLSQVYDGTARNASATTVPVGLTVGLTYDGNVAAPTNAGSYEVVGTVADANYAGISTNTLVVAKADATVTLGDLSQVYDGTVRNASATTVPVGLTVGLTYDGNVAAPTNAGSYEVVGTVADANYAGVSTNTLVVGKADATVTLGDLSQVYDGTARSASATTVPVGLTVGLTYDGNVAAPTNAGSYEVVGTVADANYAGISTNTLVVAKADATVTLGDLSQVYDGTARNASATTVPVGLTVGLTYDGNVAAPTNAGSYEVVGTVADANYAGISTNTLVVAKADATVTLGDLSQVYDGTVRNASATTVPVGLTVGLTYDGNVAAPTNAGSYEVVGTVADANYAGISTNTLVVAKADATVTLGDLSQVYDGTARNASATTVPVGLTVGLTYDGNVAAPTNAGSYEVVGTVADANYAGISTNTLVVAKADATVTLGDLSQVYDGTARNASATTVPVGLTVGLTYDGNVAAPTNAGSYEVVGTVADANYAGISTNTLVVGKADATVTLGDLSQVYDGTARNASATTVPVGLTVGLTYDGNVAAPTNAGSYEVVGTVADANYAGISTNTLVVAKADATVTLGDLSQVYDGTARNASATTVPVGLTVGLTYDGNVAAPTNAGSYEVVGTVADANYAGISTNTLVVAKADATVTLGDLSQVYDGTARNASATTVPVGLTVGLTYDGNVAAPTNAGSYEVVGTVADANYAGISTNTLVVAKADATVTLGDLSQVYDGTARNASATTVPVGLTVGLTYDGNVAAPTNAGSYEVVGTVADANYAGISTNTLVVAKADATVSADEQSKVYGDVDPALTYQITSGALASGDGFSGTLSRVAGETIGNYAIGQGTLSAGSNYSLTYVGANLTITVQALTVTANPQSKEYGNMDPLLTYLITSGTLVNGDSLTGALSRAAGETVGSYQIGQGTLSASSNYTLAYVEANLTITPRVLTVLADDKSKLFGATNPVLTFSYSGFLNGVDTSILSGSPVLSTTADTDSPVGAYPIEVDQGTLSVNNANYTLALASGTLKVGLTYINSIVSTETTNTLISWSVVSNLTCRVQYRTNVVTGDWTDLVPDVAATNNLASFVDQPGEDPQRFYRIMIVLP